MLRGAYWLNVARTLKTGSFIKLLLTHNDSKGEIQLLFKGYNEAVTASYHKKSKEDDSTAPNVCPAAVVLFPLKCKVKHEC